MSIAFWFVLVPTLCYAAAMAVYLFRGDWSMGIVYSGYAWANIGLLWREVIKSGVEGRGTAWPTISAPRRAALVGVCLLTP